MKNWKNVVRGAQNRKLGDDFEEIVEHSCELYLMQGIARIEKTPEPFRVTDSLGKGKFAGFFLKAAQPDFKGTLKGGRSIVFDAKATITKKISTSVLTDEQRTALCSYKALGAISGVLMCYDLQRAMFADIEIFLNAKVLNGHQHWTREEAEKMFVTLDVGDIVDFLRGAKDCEK